jgi:hypothetical protein
MKFVVTATTISNATLCLITNYNGEGNASKHLSVLKAPFTSRPGHQANNTSGYKHL